MGNRLENKNKNLIMLMGDPEPLWQCIININVCGGKDNQNTICHQNFAIYNTLDNTYHCHDDTIARVQNARGEESM